MSFAVIKTGWKQYKVKASDILKIERLKESKAESKIEFNEILAYGNDKNLEVGSPFVKDVNVNLPALNSIFIRSDLSVDNDENIIKKIPINKFRLNMKCNYRILSELGRHIKN